MKEAARETGAAQDALGAHCARAGIPVDRALDPAGTCLVGPELTELFTSLGMLEAKRTSLTPDLAGLLVHFLEEAGVGAGDTVAIGASGSFPALLVASLAAVEALEAHPVAVLSLGASSFGATRPGFHLLDIHRVLLDAGIVATPPGAVSLGGEGDVGATFDPDFRASLVRELEADPVPFLREPLLQENVARRMEVYCGGGTRSGTGSPSWDEACPVSAFINIGGAEANLGTDARVLSVPPGLIPDPASSMAPPPPDRRGVLFEMAARGVPIIHLLNLRGLALRYGLPWDPSLPPAPGTVELRDTTRGKGWSFWVLTAGYLLALGLVVYWSRPPLRQPG